MESDPAGVGDFPGFVDGGFDQVERGLSVGGRGLGAAEAARRGVETGGGFRGGSGRHSSGVWGVPRG